MPALDRLAEQTPSMRFYLFVLLMWTTSTVTGQSAFPLIAPATLASFLPTTVGDFDRWASSNQLAPYVPTDAEPVGGFYRTQVQTIRQSLPTASGACAITAAGILLTKDKSVNRNSQETLLIEITDYGDCLSRIRQDVDHFSLREVESGPHTFRQALLEEGIKVRTFRESQPGGILKATFIIHDRFQVFMKYQSSSVPPDIYFLTGAFRESSLYRLVTYPHQRGIASPVISPDSAGPFVASIPVQVPPSIGEYQQTSLYTTFSDHYTGVEFVYETAAEEKLTLRIYDFALRQEGWIQYQSVAGMTAEEYQHIGQLYHVAGRRVTGVILRPVHFPGEIEATLILDDRYVLRLYCESWDAPLQLGEIFTTWEGW